MLSKPKEFVEEAGIAIKIGMRSPLDQYTTNIKGKDFLLQRKTGNGQLITELSIDPLAESNESWIVHKSGVKELAVVVKKAADTVGVAIQWGGDWKTFKDWPHWEIKG